MSQPRIILYDLETLPDLHEVMKVFPSLSDYPGRTLKASITTIICFGYKVLGEEKAKCKNVWDFKSRFEKDINDDYWLCKHAGRILAQADAIVTYNGKKFDQKFLQTRLAYHGLPLLPKKLVHIDMLQIMKQNFLVYNNRMGTIGEFFIGETKLENGGWKLWVEVMNRIPEAMKLMSDYCAQDVNLLEKIYLRFRELIPNIPNHNNFVDQPQRHCPSCGSFRLYKEGTRVQKNSVIQRYRCKDCQSWSKVNIQNLRPNIKI